MRRIFVILVLIGVSTIACKKQEAKEVIPGCINAKIEEYKQSPICESGATVKEYLFQGKVVYVFDPGMCGADMAAEVFDSDCNFLGLLGGIAGVTKINGEEFSNAVFLKTVWAE